MKKPDAVTTQTRRRLLETTAWAAGAAALLGDRSSAQTAVSSNDQAPFMRFFPSGFRNERIKTSGAEINTVIGGSGPPVLMFHGLADTALLSGALNNTWDWMGQDLTLVTIPGASHFVQQDASELVSKSMRMWLLR